MTYTIDRAAYAAIYGPTTGDTIRLGDTALVVRVDHDHTHYGDECKFGGGKVLRDGQGQAAGIADADALDVVITNALVVDWTGIYKADVGIKGGRIVGIGSAGNPAIMAGITPGMIVGVGTEAIAGEGLVLTAGGIDTHVHFICPELASEAIASGVGSKNPSIATTTAADTCARRARTARSGSSTASTPKLRSSARATRSSPPATRSTRWCYAPRPTTSRSRPSLPS